MLVEIVGWASTLLILWAYWLNSMGKSNKEMTVAKWVNLTGALGMMLYGVNTEAAASVALNFVWAFIALFSIVFPRIDKL